MDKGKSAKIRNIREMLRSRGFVTEVFKDGISIDLSAAGIPGKVLYFYVFEKEKDIKSINNDLEDSKIGFADIGKNHFFGCKGDTHCYYAKFSVSEDPSEVFKNDKYAAEALEQLKDVDSKMFRQVLDDLELPRSSLVRSALTRVFRSSMDKQALLTVIAEEAKRIASANEQEILTQLKGKVLIPYISNIVCLLNEELVNSL